MKRTSTIAFFVTLLPGLFQHGLASADVRAAGSDTADPFAAYAAILNEFSQRRRLNTIFVNQQSPFDGVQISHVNTTAGNLTFARRDLMRLGRLPLQITRVYDSRESGDGDFGPGWALSLAETVRIVAGGYVYVDGSRRHYDLQRRGHRLVAKTPIAMPFEEIQIDDRSGDIVVKFYGDVAKSFRRSGPVYRMNRVSHPSGAELILDYADGRIAAIRAGDRLVTLARDNDNRIARVVDDLDRSVSYHYDSRGRLSRVVDLGGNAWTYRYDEQDRLRETIDPVGHVAMSSRYDRNSRVTDMAVRHQRSALRYGGGVTTLIETGNRQTILRHNTTGLTESVTNSAGVTSRVEFDDRNRVVGLSVSTSASKTPPVSARLIGLDVSKQLSGNVLLRAETFGVAIAYRGDGSPASVVRANRRGVTKTEYHYGNDFMTAKASNGSSLALHYDAHDRLLRRQTNGRPAVVYEYAPNGDLTGVVEADTAVNFQYDDRGFATAIARDGRKQADLEYSAEGRVSKITFADGLSLNYTYNPLGLRDYSGWSNDMSQRFAYDATGNLRAVHSDYAGLTVDTRIELDDENKIRQFSVGESSSQLGYDAEANLVAIDQGGSLLEFRYDVLGRPTAALLDSETVASHNYEPGDVSLAWRVDGRTPTTTLDVRRTMRAQAGVMDVAYGRYVEAIYEHVLFDPARRAFALHEVDGWLDNDADQAVRNALMRAKLTGEMSAMDFDRPSNAVFLPPEFASVNCCPPPPCNYPPCQLPTGADPAGEVVTLTRMPMCGFVQITESSRLALESGLANAIFTSGEPPGAVVLTQPMNLTTNEHYTLRRLYVNNQLHGQNIRAGTSAFSIQGPINANSGVSELLDAGARHRYATFSGGTDWTAMESGGISGMPYQSFAAVFGQQSDIYLGHPADATADLDFIRVRRFGNSAFPATIIGDSVTTRLD